jgi:hypothetical protein
MRQLIESNPILGRLGSASALGLCPLLFRAIHLPAPDRDSPFAGPGDAPDTEHDFVLWGFTLGMLCTLLTVS